MVGITYPWMLVGLAAVGLPVLIHFLTRPRPRTVLFPTYHLLVQAGSGRQSMHRLRTWIVLALRTLAVAAFVFAFARPFLKTPGADVEPGAPRRVVLIVDASMSMRAVEGGVPLFTRARAQAADVLRHIEEGSTAAVIYMGTTPRAALPALSRNLASLHESLSNAEPTLEKGDPMAALALAKTMLEGSGSVYIFSDFQRTNWGAVSFDAFKGLSFLLRPVTERGIDNVGLVAVEKSPGEPIEGETIEMTCTVFNATPDRRQETVHLDLEGVTQTADVALQPYSSGTVTFSLLLPTAGCYPGRVTLTPDDLSDDDVRYFKVDVRHTLDVLVISDADRDDATSAAFFIEAALCPSEYAATGINVIRRHSQDVDSASLQNADAFFVVSPVQLRGDTVGEISDRVVDGAYLVCFLDGPSAPVVVSAFEGASDGAISPPFKLQRRITAAQMGGDRFGDMRTGHNALKVFASPDQGDLGGLAFRRHFMTATAPERREEVLIEYPDGSAALGLSPAGRGAAIFANFPVAPSGSDLAGSPLFPSLLHELMRALRTTGGDEDPTPGTPWTIGVPATSIADAPAEAIRIVGPGGREVDATITERAQTVRFALPSAVLAGHYTVRCEDTDADVAVVNVDAKETDTRPLNIAALLDKKSVPEGGAISVLDREGQLRSAGKPTPLWPYLVALAAVCLGVEMLLLAVWRRRDKQPLVAHLEGRAV